MDDIDDVLEELARLPTIAHPTVSPDGSEVALYYDVTGRNELHVLDVETGNLTKWSEGEVPRNARWHVTWGADGERVFFHRDEAGDEQNDVYAVSRDGTVGSVVEMDGQVVVSDAHEDGLLLASNRDGQQNLYWHDFEDGTGKVTDYERAVWAAELSPDGERIAYSTNETDDFDNRDAYVADRDGSKARVLDAGESGAETDPVDWGPDGERLLLRDNSADLDRVGVYDLGSDGVTWLGDGDYEETPEAFLPGGERVVGTRVRDAVRVPVVYDLATGESREFDLPDGVAEFGMAGESVVDDDRVILTHTTPTTRPSLLAYDLASDEAETLVGAEHGPFEPDDFADAEYFTVRSDGVPETRQAAVEHDPYEEMEIGALLYDSGERPSPLVVNPHGGPRGRDEKRFDLYTQVLAARGFSVLKVNYRGSTGRGREFVRALDEDWGGAEQGDVLTAAEHVLKEYDWLDDDRVVVFGGSYGGYSAYWQLVQYPDFYDAGVAWIGLTDLEDQYENTMPHYRTELMERYLGTPEENPDLYEERSPVTHVENVDAPLFILHGVNDRRVPVSQARIFREALTEAGYEEGEAPRASDDASGEPRAGRDGDFEYRELGEEGHASSDQEQKLRMFRLLDDFLRRRVGAPRAAPGGDD